MRGICVVAKVNIYVKYNDLAAIAIWYIDSA